MKNEHRACSKLKKYMRPNEERACSKLEKYALKMLFEKGIRLREDEYISLAFNAGGAVINILNSNEKTDNFFELYYKGMIHPYKNFLRSKGLSEKEIDEFCKNLELKYKELEKEIFPYIV